MWMLIAPTQREALVCQMQGTVQKRSSSKAATNFARGAYWQYVSEGNWRKRRWRFFSTAHCLLCPLRWLPFVLVIPIILLELGVGCAQFNTHGSNVAKTSSFSVYVLSRGKGVPEQAMNVLNQVRQVLKLGEDQGKVTRLVDRRIGLEGETQLCAEFSDEQAADQFFNKLHGFSRGVDLVNIKKERCPR